ncbi:bifunctional 3'-5' exonuclease/DNA polymerase [Kribbella capetownensis]|uniref:DNA-directed DNA polymerase n=1 Tax=Kribbella capetownensis TaxID=1572659 RepID=A0A4R0JTW1_9ACTN|nr:bifunctional 3'-5' exonuclease/DNA polymerase [Kribbella capetownensis]TCC48568.1 bifunctional 3'-5' exonuclease/DNA polymerase [Kribbella capetownensis]
MDERWAIAPEEGGGAVLVALHPDGQPAGPVLHEPSLAGAVGSRPQVSRWVWRSSAEIYPRLLAGGVRVERCYDIENSEGLLLGHAGRLGEPRSAAAAWGRLSGGPVPPDPPLRAVVPGEQSSLFEIQEEPVAFEALLRVYADQLRRHGEAEYPDRMRLLTASESSGMLVAAEMDRAGLPWSSDAHRAVLSELLGERFGGTGEPRRLTELADQVSEAFGRRVRPDLPADVLKAFKQAGYQLKSTRRWELETIDHPAVEPLVEYKKLYRIYTANGWSWLQDWVHDGRFRPGFVPGGTVSGRWITNGGGGLQIPKVIRRAVVADPGWSLVVADASQLEPRILAAISRDPALMEVSSDPGDLYKAVSDQAFSGDRAKAKLAVLGAIYGQTSGDGLKNLAMLRRRFPLAVAYVDDAARAGEEGRLVRTWLGRTCPPTGAQLDDAMLEGPPADEPQTDARHARARGRFTRNFVVQGSAADWALLMLAALRQSLADLKAELVFFQHDEVIVHCPTEEAPVVVEAIQAASNLAGTLTFGPTPTNFAFTTTTTKTYADAK